MQSKRLKFWIIFGFILLSIIVFFLVIFFCFRLRTVDVEFQSRLSQSESKIPQNVKDTVKEYFKYNDNIILMDFNDAISGIEKDIPFIKVNSVIKHFPNTARVYVSERVPKYRVKEDTLLGEWLILDEDLKVLDRVSNDVLIEEGLYSNSSYFNKTVEIYSDKLKVTAQVGDFISGKDDIKSMVNEIMSGVYGRTEDYFSVNKIVIGELNGETDINIVMRNDAIDDGNGCNILIEGSDDLLNKTFVAMSTFQEEIKNDATINTPVTTIRIYYSNGSYKGIRI